MQHISKLQGHFNHVTVSNNKIPPLRQPRKSRCAKPQAKRPVSTKLTNRHAGADSSAYKAFLSQCSTQLDQFVSFGEPRIAKPDTSRSNARTAKDEDEEADGDWVNQTVDSRFDLSRQIPKNSSFTNLRKNTPTFDLLALIPPSALAPYLPPLSLTLDLFDVYFLEVPSAKLMFDHQRVIDRYQNSTLPHQVLFAILALASLYSHESASSDGNVQKTMALKEAHNRGRVWADIASQMALAKADNISLTTVRTCEQLALYWIAIGERDRANCHADISYQLYRTLVKFNPHGENGVNLSRASLFHRCVAEYQSNTNFKTLYPEFSSRVVEDNLLPAGATLGFEHQNGWDSQASAQRFPGTKYAVGIVALWRELMTLLQQSLYGAEISDGTLVELESRFCSFYKSLPNTLKADNLMDYQLAGPAQDAKLCFAIIHCANMICLHSYRLRIFAKLTKSTDSDPGHSERIVIEMARLGGELIHEHISTFSKNRKIPPMAGYCVFAIGSVHAHMNEFRDGPGWSEPWINGVSCLLLLEHLKSHWPALDNLCRDLRKRFSYGDPNMMTIPTDLLWQLAGYRSATTPLSTDQYTTGFFGIPYSNSFIQEMLGFTEESFLCPEKRFSSPMTPQSLHSDTLSGSNRSSSQHFKGLPPHQTMGKVGTDPPTFNFEANLLGIIESRFH